MTCPTCDDTGIEEVSYCPDHQGACPCLKTYTGPCRECNPDGETSCGYWQHPSQHHRMCGECDSCTGYGDYQHEQWKDRQMEDLDRRGR